jgi:hypothetical protein
VNKKKKKNSNRDKDKNPRNDSGAKLRKKRRKENPTENEGAHLRKSKKTLNNHRIIISFSPSISATTKKKMRVKIESLRYGLSGYRRGGGGELPRSPLSRLSLLLARLDEIKSGSLRQLGYHRTPLVTTTKRRSSIRISTDRSRACVSSAVLNPPPPPFSIF